MTGARLSEFAFDETCLSIQSDTCRTRAEKILRRELEVSMELTGVNRLSDVGPHSLVDSRPGAA